MGGNLYDAGLLSCTLISTEKGIILLPMGAFFFFKGRTFSKFERHIAFARSSVCSSVCSLRLFYQQYISKTI